MKKKLINLPTFACASLLLVAGLTSCADDKDFYFRNGKEITQDEYFEQNDGYKITKDTFEVITAEPYGWGNYEDKKLQNVKYELVTGNVVWGVILCETIVMPVYFSGWAIYEPVSIKDFKKPCH